MVRRKICVITGTRAEYGLLTPVIKQINACPDLELLLMVTGMHLSADFGRTIDLIKGDGLKVAYKVHMNLSDDNAESMAFAIGKGIIGMARAFKNRRPDITLILGDRIEALAGVIASSYLNIPVAHIHGGDISMAGLDELARHAITKMSHVHFAASKKSKERIIKMGERPENVFLTGAPALDTILREPLLPKADLEKACNMDMDKPFLILVQHSVTTQIGEAKSQIRKTLNSIKQIGMPAIIICPNSDAGGRAIIKEINKAGHLKYIRIFTNLPHMLYLSLLKRTAVLVGNSSSGIIESSSFKVPVVNIGIRQNGRERSTNIINVAHDTNAITKAIRKAVYDKKFKDRIKRCKNSYGDGHAGERIVKVLRSIKLGNSLLYKQIAY